MALRRPSDALSDLDARVKRRDHASIERQTRRVQIAIPLGGDPGPYRGKGAPPPAAGIMPAIVTQAITPASGTTPGTGQVQPYYLAAPDDTTATADADQANMPVLNWYQSSGTIPVGSHVLVAGWSNALWLLGADC